MKKVFAYALVLLLLSTGCGAGNNSSSSSWPVEPESSLPEAVVEEGTEPEEIETPPEEEAVDPLEGLIRDEYEGLAITAAVLERKAILPGFSVPVTVTIQNTGDKTVFYTQGSGVFETPEALILQSEDLQPVLPKDHLGIMTMDFVTKELKPGEELQFVLYVMAIKPTPSFDSYTYDMFNADQTYIVDMEWAALQEEYPDLVAVEPGSYTVYANFRYLTVGEGEEASPMAAPTGYAQAECVIGVS